MRQGRHHTLCLETVCINNSYYVLLGKKSNVVVIFHLTSLHGPIIFSFSHSEKKV